MKLELREANPGFVVLSCCGGLSWEERELLVASVDDYLLERDDMQGMVVDMGAVEFVNSAGLGALFQLEQRVRNRGGQLAFANLPPTIHRLLVTVGMSRLAKLGQDVAHALSLLAATENAPQDCPDDAARG
jgi:anti-anti-sigma factor